MKTFFFRALVLGFALGLAHGALAIWPAAFPSNLSQEDALAKADGLSFDEALDLLEQSALEQPRLMGEMMAVGLEIQAAHGNQWMQTAEARLLFEELMEPIQAALSSVHSDISVAALRLFRAPEPGAMPRAFERLSDLGLASLLSHHGLIALMDQESDRLPEQVGQSAAMQDRIYRLLANDQRLIDLMLDPTQRDELLASRAMGDPEEVASWTLGSLNFFDLLKLLPQEQMEQVLTDITAGTRFGHLERDLHQAITNGYLGQLIELSPDWIGGQIEAGHHIWLAHLAAANDDAGTPELFARIDGLPRSEQLPVIANAGDAALFPLVREIHADMMLALACIDCPDRPALSEQEYLMRALVGMGLPEAQTLAWELLDAATSDHRKPLAALAFNSNMRLAPSGNAAFYAELLESFPDLPLNTWQLGRWPGEQAELLATVVEQRLDDWLSTARSGKFEGMMRWSQCEAFGLLMFAHGHGWFDGWSALVDELGEAELTGQALESCGYNLGGISNNTHRVELLATIVDFLEVAGAGPDRYQSVFNTARFGEHIDHEQARLMLLDRLEGSATWDQLPKAYTVWLTDGDNAPVGTPARSCGSSEDEDEENGKRGD